MSEVGMLSVTDLAWHAGLPTWLPLHVILRLDSVASEAAMAPPIPGESYAEQPGRETNPPSVKIPPSHTFPDERSHSDLAASQTSQGIHKKPPVVIVHLGSALKDAVLIWFLNWVGGAVIGRLSDQMKWSVLQYTVALWIAAFASGSIGFTISGCSAPSPRLHYLGVVALAFWLLTGFTNAFLIGMPAEGWFKSIGVVVVDMFVGWGASHLMLRGRLRASLGEARSSAPPNNSI